MKMQPARPSQKELAARLGLSTAAVSNILRGKGRFAEATRRRVLRELDQAGYRPRQRLRPVLYLGLKTPALDAWHVLSVFASMQGIGAELQPQGIAWRSAFLPGYDHHSASPWSEAADALASVIGTHQPSGVLVDTGLHHARAFSRQLREAGIPAVMMGHEIDVAGTPAVLVDSFGGAYDATARLIAEGHRRIGLLRWNTTVVASSPKKFAGYRCALEAHGLPFAPECVVEARPSRGGLPDPAQRLGREAFGRLLVQCGTRPPTAVLVENSFISESLIYPLVEDQGRLPEILAQTAFIHFEDLPLSVPVMAMSGGLNYPEPHLCVCRIDWERLARTATRILLQLLDQGTDSGLTLTIKPEIREHAELEAKP
jgi:LacI family transcriptional regulator